MANTRQSGFYVPSTTSAPYVANKRDESGTLKYEGAYAQVGLQEQAALQQLRTQYDQTINNAYAAYLAQNRGIMGSTMGQGYKNAYLEASRQNVMSNIAEANLNAAQVRQELSANVGEQVGSIAQAQQQETNYFNRAEVFARDYYDYLKGLTAQDESGNVVNYLDEFERSLNTPEYAYDKIFATNAVGSNTMTGYYDTEGNAAMSFDDWIYSQMGGSSEDQDWYQWYMEQGGKGEYENIAQRGLEERKANYMGTGKSYEDVKTEYETQKAYQRQMSWDGDESRVTHADGMTAGNSPIIKFRGTAKDDEGNDLFKNMDTMITLSIDTDSNIINIDAWDKNTQNLMQSARTGQLFLVNDPHGETRVVAKLKNGNIINVQYADKKDEIIKYLNKSVFDLRGKEPKASNPGPNSKDGMYKDIYTWSKNI